MDGPLEQFLDIDDDNITIILNFHSNFQDDLAANMLNEVMKNDDLSKLEEELKLEAEKTILNAANLIAPVIEDTLTAGFAWYVVIYLPIFQGNRC